MFMQNLVGILPHRRFTAIWRDTWQIKICESWMSVLALWVVVDRREPQLFVRRSLFWSCGPRDESVAFKQTVRGKYADVCSRTWVVFSAAAVLVSLRLLQPHQPRCLYCPGNTKVTFTGYVTAVHLDVWLWPAHCIHTDAEPIGATCGLSSFVYFGGLFLVMFFRLSCYWERCNLIPGNFGYWKQVESSQPYRLCIFFSCPSQKKM